ncbi:MAG: CBS domain-containing protein [Rhodospirillales bacterium]|nr:CBS domain-containing protein [Rhodospirillales bacterium]
MTMVAAILRHKGNEVIAVAPGASVPEIAEVLRARGIGAVLVTDRLKQMLGIVSERDIVRSLAARGAATLEMTAAQLMTRVMTTVTPASTAEQAMRLMTEHRVRHLPVLEQDHVVGLVSIGDVVKACMMEQEQEVDSLRAYIAGAA